MTQSNTDTLRSFFGETGVATLRQMERICLNSQSLSAASSSTKQEALHVSVIKLFSRGATPLRLHTPFFRSGA